MNNFILALKKNKAIFIFLILIFGILVNINSHFSERDFQGGETENLELAYHLYNYGTFAMIKDSTGTPIASSYREPFPPMVTAAYMFLNPHITHDITLESIKSGEYAIPVKRVNLIWVFLLMLGSCLLLYGLTQNLMISIAGFIGVVFYFIRFGSHFDNLFTELPTAVLIVWASFFLLKALKNKTYLPFFVFGLMTGLLILTKASFFYLSIPIVVLVIYISNHNVVRNFIVISTGILIVVSPWLIRNYVQFGEINIVQRGGEAIFNRVLINQIEKDEAIAAMYYWGPELYQSLVKGTNLQVDENEFLLGGQYQKLVRYPALGYVAINMGMPDKTYSYHSMARAEQNRLEFKYRELGYSFDSANKLAHSEMKSESMNWIINNPVRHSIMTPLFFWRGMWCFPNSTIPFLSKSLQVYIHNLVNGISYIMLFLMFFYGIIKRDEELFSISVVPVIMMLFYGGVSHYLPRYSEPAIPSMVIGLVFASFLLWKKFR